MSEKFILAVDPSTTISGYCLGYPGRVIESGILRGGTIKDTDKRVNLQIWNLVSILKKHNVTKLYAFVVEKPATWQSGRGMKAAMSGALQELSRAEGMMTMAFRIGFSPKHVITATPIQWKGQLPKIIMFERMKKKWNLGPLKPTGANMNQTDAVGLFDWYLTRHYLKS